MESMDVAGVLQDAGDADSRAAPDPNHKLNISLFPTCPHPLWCERGVKVEEEGG